MDGCFCSPFQSSLGPAAFKISSYSVQPIAFPTILQSTSPTPIGLTPGFLFRGISLHAMQDSKHSGSVILVEMSFANIAIYSPRCFPSALKCLLQRILRNCSESKCEGPAAPPVFLAAFCMRFSSILSK